ncbi:MAG: hypothetical protein AABY42_06310 [Nitrospirota bacterium]
MAQTITIELLQLLEDKLGKEEGRKVAEAINIGLDAIEKKADAVVLQKKLELKDELTKELITKAEFFGEIKTLRQEMQTMKVELEAKIDQNKIELEGKIAKLDQKFNFMIILMIIALTLMNPVVAEIIKRALKL